MKPDRAPSDDDPSGDTVTPERFHLSSEDNMMRKRLIWPRNESARMQNG